MELSGRYEVVRWKGGSLRRIKDEVVRETELEIFVNGKSTVTLTCSPLNRIELGLGFLKTEGVISNYGDVKKIEFGPNLTEVRFFLDADLWEDEASGGRQRRVAAYDGTVRKRKGNSLDGISGGKKFQLDISKLFTFMSKLQQNSDLFRRTGGSHAAALGDGKSILLRSEDIGRHNTVDKVIGREMIKGTDFAHRVLLVSGRVSSEMLVKSTMAGIPMVVSRSAPTDKAIEIARRREVTLVGFLRGDRMTIYSRNDRLTGINRPN